LVGDEPTVRGSHAAAAEALVHLDRARYTIAAEAANRAITIARGRGATRELARGLTTQGQVLTQVGETNRADASFAEAASLFDDVSDALVRARSLRWRGW